MFGEDRDVRTRGVPDAVAMTTNITTEARVLLAEFAALAGGLAALALSGLTG
jgi:hypothetical protein